MTKILVLAYNNRDNADMFSPGMKYCTQLENMFLECEFRFKPLGEHTMEDMLWSDVVSGHPPRGQLGEAKNIKWVHLQSAGVDGYTDKSIYANPDIVVTRTADVFGAAMAEHTIGMMLSLCRLMPKYMRHQANHVWQRDYDEKYELTGATVLILGAGSLASDLIRRLSGFDCKIIGVRRDVSKPAAGFDKVYPASRLHTALGEADFVVSTLPHTPSTEKFMGAAEFAAMKPSAFFFNIGRGVTVDQGALISALQHGKIAGAGLDVTDPEPLEKENPLWDMENVILTPHSSGFSERTNDRRLELFAALIRQYLAGETLSWQIDFDAGY